MGEDEKIIVVENNKSEDEDFAQLLRQTDSYLNVFASHNENYFIGRNGTDLEIDVCEALKKCAKHTIFEGTISLVSGSSFPDIVANQYYGVEVKSTKENKWKSIGSSILESTRIKDIKKIYLTFGKLGSPVKFLSRPYEQCLYDISITHYPRYQIDMMLKPEETIFKKMNIEYEKLRKLKDPVKPVAAYYKKQLKPGQTLWWAGGAEDIEQTSLAPYISIWNTLDEKTQIDLLSKGYTYYPELLTQEGEERQTKYNRFTLWIAQKGIVSPNVRDACSAGGKKDVITFNGIFEEMPAVFLRVFELRKYIWNEILNTPAAVLRDYWGVEEVFSGEARINLWCRIAARKAIKLKPTKKDKKIIPYELALNCLTSSLFTK